MRRPRVEQGERPADDVRIAQAGEPAVADRARQCFAAEVWKRLAEIEKRFDPNDLIFTAPPAVERAGRRPYCARRT